MGLFVAKPKLEPGERVLSSLRANRSLGKRAIGGRLLVTHRRLIFSPHVVDRLLHAESWSWPLTAIDEVGAAARTLEQPLSGGARRRLEVKLVDGGHESFVVNHVERVIAAVTAAKTKADSR